MAQTTRCKPERFVSPTQTKCRHKGSLLCVGVLKVRAFRCKYVPSIFPYSPWPYTWPWHYMGATWDPCSKKHIKSYKLVPSSRAKELCKSVCEEDPRHRKGVPDWWLLPSQESLVYPWGGGQWSFRKKMVHQILGNSRNHPPAAVDCRNPSQLRLHACWLQPIFWWLSGQHPWKTCNV